MYDVLIIGCGISGAAAAFELSKYRLKVAVLEKENDVSTGTTKANSAILHAGYDPEPGTLMARLNVRGSALARTLCPALDVPYRPCGSLVLGFSEADRAALQALWQRGRANGVPGLALLPGPADGGRPLPLRHLRPSRPHGRRHLPLGVLPRPGGDRSAQRCGGVPGRRGVRHRQNPRRLAGLRQAGGL